MLKIIVDREENFTQNQWIVIVGCGFGIGVFGAVSATLWDRRGGLIYNDHLNITWLQDANYAKISGYDADGLLIWNQAMT